MKSSFLTLCIYGQNDTCCHNCSMPSYYCLFYLTFLLAILLVLVLRDLNNLHSLFGLVPLTTEAKKPLELDSTTYAQTLGSTASRCSTFSLMWQVLSAKVLIFLLWVIFIFICSQLLGRDHINAWTCCSSFRVHSWL